MSSYKFLTREKKASIYNKVLQMRKTTKSGANKIAKRLGLPITLVRGWIYENHKPTCIKKNVKIIDRDTEQILLGSLLGDGHLGFSGRSMSPFYYEPHSLKQENYIKWKEKYFKIFDTKFKKRNVFNKYRNKIYQRVEIFTKSDPTFDFYYSLFYQNGKKKITQKILDKLQPLGIAVWYCDDGHLDLVKGEIILGTYTSYEENVLIQQWFKEKFGINCKIRKRYNNQYVILFNFENSQKFINLIKDFVPSCMRYKIDYDLKKIRKNQHEQNKKHYIKNIIRRREMSKRYYWLHREERLKAHKEWVNRNRKRYYEYQKLWRRKNREKVKEYGKRYRDKNKERERLRHRLYYRKNREKILAYNREYYRKKKTWQILLKNNRFK